MKKSLKRAGLNLSSGFVLTTPGNYTPFGGAKPKAKQDKMFQKQEQRIKEISQIVKEAKCKKEEKAFFLSNMILSAIYRWAAPKIPNMDKDFWITDKCNSCGMCAKVCPVNNIEIIEGKPKWQHKCEQCFACLQWCPQEAIVLILTPAAFLKPPS